MSSLLLRLAGPMQSWGTQSRFTTRDTEREPSKSGVLGLVCAACGVGRSDVERLEELSRLRMGVRVEREGRVMRDFQTAGGGNWPGRKRYGVAKASGAAGQTLISERYYLADARFLVALEGDRAELELIQSHLHSPVWTVYLGRKAFVPSEPVWLPDGLRDMGMEAALRSYPWESNRGSIPERIRMVLECGSDEGQPRLDVPLSFESGSRRFGMRYVKTEWMKGSTLGANVSG